MAARPHPHVHATYRLVAEADGSFAIEVSIPDTPPTRVSGFDTQGKAEAWIERHQANIATGTLGDAWSQRFKRQRDNGEGEGKRPEHRHGNVVIKPHEPKP